MEKGELILEDRLYTTEHDWIQKVGDKRYKVGITDFAQHALKDIYVIELPKLGQVLTKGQDYGILEASKDVFTLKMPITGKIIAINEKEKFGEINDDEGETATRVIFGGDLYNLNKKPYETWLIEIETDDESQLEKLLKPDDYKKEIEKYKKSDEA
ncbi:MAG: hypothetical protein Q8O03_01455 [Nanoarchaeota archaeon]|nr:hypothetical protein [Nanoarchaeota archaeon]